MRARSLIRIIGLLALSVWPTYSQAGAALVEARTGFKTTLTRMTSDREPLQPPPPGLFSIVKFDTPLGKMGAYLSTPPGPGKHPAILWITGGFPAGGIDSSAWEPAPPDNDQSAKVYRTSGLVMMYPTFRGSFGNPGHQETFFGEVDDVLSALAYLRQVDYVDPDRIYLGGHSTGGTLALLVAAATDGFRAVFSFGPVSSPADYGDEVLTYDPGDEREDFLRSPINFLEGIHSPTWVIGGSESGNFVSIDKMRRKNRNPKVHFETVRGATHFDLLASVNRLIAQKIAKLDGEAALSLTGDEIQGAFDDFKRATREASDLRTIADLRQSGIEIGAPQSTRHYLLARERTALVAAAKEAAHKGFTQQELSEHKDSKSRPFFVLVVTKKLTPRDLDAVFAASKAMTELAREHGLHYDGWDAE